MKDACAFLGDGMSRIEVMYIYGLEMDKICHIFN